MGGSGGPAAQGGRGGEGGNPSQGGWGVGRFRLLEEEGAGRVLLARGNPTTQENQGARGRLQRSHGMSSMPEAQKRWIATTMRFFSHDY